MPAARGVTITEPDDRPSGAAGNTLGLTAEVDLLVLEYLAHAGYERATQNLKAELRERREGKTATWRPVGAEMQEKVKDRMLRALDRGEREEVLRLWDNFVPPLLRKSDKNAQKLEFYLNIFFAIYPLHPTNQPQPAASPPRCAPSRLFETDSLAVTPEFSPTRDALRAEIARHPRLGALHPEALALKARLADFLARTCALCIQLTLSHTSFLFSNASLLPLPSRAGASLPPSPSSWV